MGIKFANNASSTLAVGITPTDTSITLSSGTGSKFPSLGVDDWFYCTLITAATNTREIVKCTARSGDVLTIVRAQDGTTASAFSAGDLVRMQPVAGMFSEFVNASADNTFTGNNTFTGGNTFTGNNIFTGGNTFSNGLTSADVLQLSHSTIASGATVDLGTATGNTVTVTHTSGTTAITSLGGASLQKGTQMTLVFSITGGTLSLTHHATNLILAGGADITLANGDVITFVKNHDSNAEWKMTGGVKADGTAWKTSDAYGTAAGEVLQIVYYTDAGASTSSSTLANVTNSAKPITPKSNDSTIIVECMFQGKVNAGGTGTNTTGEFKLYDYGSSSDIGSEYQLGVTSGSGTNVNTLSPSILRAFVSNTTLSTRSFILRARYSTAATTVYAQNHVWKLTEIKN